MRADKLLYDTLSAGVGLPVHRVVAKYQTVDEIPPQYFVYSITSGTPAYSDDFMPFLELFYAVSLFSRTDYTSVLKQAVMALNTEGARIVSFGAETYDPDIDFYQIQINVSIIETWGDK